MRMNGMESLKKMYLSVTDQRTNAGSTTKKSEKNKTNFKQAPLFNSTRCFDSAGPSSGRTDNIR
jgi:hypothetical protein